MSYATPLTVQASRNMGWSKSRGRRYWNQRAMACTQFSDEGECLAQVERHAPVTLEGLGASTASNVGSSIAIIAGLIANPDATLRAHGPALIRAVDTHVMDPLVNRLAAQIAPYMLKYVVPPVAVLYVLNGVGIYYSHMAATKGRVKENRRRGGRRRTSRRR